MVLLCFALKPRVFHTPGPRIPGPGQAPRFPPSLDITFSARYDGPFQANQIDRFSIASLESQESYLIQAIDHKFLWVI